ncbi:Uncharacterized protein ChrSV_3115 [Chromobacterium vaccinii]|nr:Uncharacterized protein ChrSW_3115 [Chromobacterium vaccinii]QND90572.1 Uncharacterized protein ChrSV_3115 [Chromobacterium vaccinii]
MPGRVVKCRKLVHMLRLGALRKHLIFNESMERCFVEA